MAGQVRNKNSKGEIRKAKGESRGRGFRLIVIRHGESVLRRIGYWSSAGGRGRRGKSWNAEKL